MLAKRARDTSRTGFREWAFMTTHNWGEMAVGLWTLEINNDGWDGKFFNLLKNAIYMYNLYLNLLFYFIFLFQPWNSLYYIKTGVP